MVPSTSVRETCRGCCARPKLRAKRAGNQQDSRHACRFRNSTTLQSSNAAHRTAAPGDADLPPPAAGCSFPSRPAFADRVCCTVPHVTGCANWCRQHIQHQPGARSAARRPRLSRTSARPGQAASSAAATSALPCCTALCLRPRVWGQVENNFTRALGGQHTEACSFNDGQCTPWQGHYCSRHAVQAANPGQLQNSSANSAAGLFL